MSNDGNGEAVATGVSILDVDATVIESPGSYATRIENLSIEVLNPNNFTGGIPLSNADVVVRDTYIRVGSAATSNLGIVIDSVIGTERLYLESVSVYASGAGVSGLYTVNFNSSVFLNNSHFVAAGVSPVGITAAGGDVYVTNSTIITDGIALRATQASSVITATFSRFDAATNALASGGSTISCSFVSELATGTGYSNTCS